MHISPHYSLHCFINASYLRADSESSLGGWIGFGTTIYAVRNNALLYSPLPNSALRNTPPTLTQPPLYHDKYCMGCSIGVGRRGKELGRNQQCTQQSKQLPVQEEEATSNSQTTAWEAWGKISRTYLPGGSHGERCEVFLAEHRRKRHLTG